MKLKKRKTIVIKKIVYHLPPHEPKFIVSQLSQSMGWGIKQWNIPKTWCITQGDGIKIMVIDTGHPNHRDIGTNAIEGRNFIKGESINDFNGHQTHVTGIICAKNNEEGMVGVAPKAQCITVKALDANGNGSFKAVNSALAYAFEVKPDIISMSLGAPAGDEEQHDLIKSITSFNIPIICAAGNSGQRGVDYPGAYPEVITVGAYNENGDIANFSAIGEQVDWAAPGVKIYSTYLNEQYCLMDGTSQATPYMVGVVALLLSKHRKQEAETGLNDCKTVAQIKEHLLKYTIDKGMVGKDNYFGFGVVNVEDLIFASKDSDKVIIVPTPVNPHKSFWQKIINWFKKIFKS